MYRNGNRNGYCLLYYRQWQYQRPYSSFRSYSTFGRKAESSIPTRFLLVQYNWINTQTNCNRYHYTSWGHANNQSILKVSHPRRMVSNTHGEQWWRWDNIITIQLTDGRLADDDGVANGIIVDQGGPGTPLAPDLVITEKWLCWPDNCTICYNVTNIGEGTAPACPNTALWVNGVEGAHDHVPVDLAPGESYTGCFDDYTWTYTPQSDDITVCADNDETLVELDKTNNCLTNIWMCGDVNCDSKVTMSDVRNVFNRYFDPGYELNCCCGGGG